MKINVFRTAAAAALCLVAAAATAKDFSTTIDLAPAQPLARVSKKFPGFGYVCDPKVGGEETLNLIILDDAIPAGAKMC